MNARGIPPPCSKYSLCCPNWVPPQARVPPLGGGTPRPGYPPWPGYPPSQGTPPRLDLAGYPPAGPGRVPPPWLPHGILAKCCKALWDMGTPPPLWTDRIMDGWKDRHVSKHYLPVVLRTRAVKIISNSTRNTFLYKYY